MAPAADAQRVAEILEREGVTQTAPSPGIGEWAAEAVTRAVNWIDDQFGSSMDLGSLGPVVFWVVLGTALFGLCLAIINFLSRQNPRPRRTDLDDGEVLESPASRTDWQKALRDALMADDLGRALEAVWWMLLVGLDSGTEGQTLDSRPGATGRKALRRAGREELMPLVFQLEAMTYGKDQPTRSSISRLAQDVEAAFS